MKYIQTLSILVMVMITSCHSKRLIETDEVYLTRQYGFSQAILADGFLFTSGQVGWDTNYQLAGSSFSDQVDQTLKNIDCILKRSGGTFSDVVQIRFYVKDLDMNKRNTLNTCISKYFPTHYKPASTLLGVSSLAHEDLEIEIEIIAQLSNSKLANK